MQGVIPLCRKSVDPPGRKKPAGNKPRRHRRGLIGRVSADLRELLAHRRRQGVLLPLSASAAARAFSQGYVHVFLTRVLLFEHPKIDLNPGVPLLVLGKQHVSNGCKMYLFRSPVKAGGSKLAASLQNHQTRWSPKQKGTPILN